EHLLLEEPRQQRTRVDRAAAAELREVARRVVDTPRGDVLLVDRALRDRHDVRVRVVRIRRAGFDGCHSVRTENRSAAEWTRRSAGGEELLLGVRFAEKNVRAVLLFLHGNERDLPPHAVTADLRSA